MADDVQSTFDHLESEARYYCRRLPNLLKSADGSIVTDVDGNDYIDLMSACGSLNYGHSHPQLKAAAVDFLTSNGIAAALDFHTTTKLEFMVEFERRILGPKGLDYKMQFPGPTGANCIEAALKLARKVTGRTNVVAFTNAFHGVSLGALAATGSSHARRSSPMLGGVTRLPFEGYRRASVEDLLRFEAMAGDPSGGVDPIAAFIVETVQGEGGLNVASPEWLRQLSEISTRLGAVLIVDDIQAGCGRSGSFFSFERAAIIPDMVCLAKSIGGYGFPMSLLLLKRDLDLWLPGEHNGTFRGNSIAFATAAAALRLWSPDFEREVEVRSRLVGNWCEAITRRHTPAIRRKGLGMMQGIEFAEPTTADAVAMEAIRRGVLIECCGPRDEVLKIMAPLNIDIGLLKAALDRLTDIIDEMADREPHPRALPVLEGDDPSLDPGDHRGDAIVSSQLTHHVREMEFNRLLGDT